MTWLANRCKILANRRRGRGRLVQLRLIEKKVSHNKNELKTLVIAYSGASFSTASSPIMCKKMHAYLGVGPMHSVCVCV